MNVTELFIRRPVMTTLVMLGTLFLGVVAYLTLPTSYLPSVEFPTIQVSASLPGASPETMATSVATPLEREFSGIAGLTAMSSVNQLGSSSITLQFDLNRDIDSCAMDVQAAITEASGSLPDDMPSPPSFSKVNPADQPIMYISITANAMRLSDVNDYLRTFLTQSISTVPGVAQVLIYGEQQYAVRIRLDPRQLASRGLGINEVAEAVALENVNLPTGSLEGREISYTIDSQGQLMVAADYAPLIVAWRDGQPVRLQDLGVVEDGVADERFSAYYNGTKNLLIAIKRQPGANTVEVAEDIRQSLPGIMSQMPADIRYDIVYDQSIFIEESVQDVEFTLELAVALVILVVFIFLRSIWGTIIASIAIPFSIIATFAVMYALDFTLDNISLMALTLAVGFVVDDAIVVLENVVRHLEMGKKPFQAALDGAREIGFTIISMTLSLAVVFVPLVFMAGMIGRVLHEFAVTITAAILLSGVVSLSLTPMMSSRFLRAQSRLAHSDKIFDFITKHYKASLSFCIRHRFATLIASFGLLGLTAWLFVIMPKGFLPSNDMDYIYGFAQARQGISYAAMDELQTRIGPIMMQDPAVRGQFQVIGHPRQNQGMTFVLLQPRQDRDASANEVLARLWPQVNTIPGLQVFLVNPPMIEIGGKQGRGDYMVTLLGADTETLYAAAPKLLAAIQGIEGITFATSDLEISNPQLDITIDRDLAASLGITANEIENALYSAYGTRKISTIYGDHDEYDVIMELLPEFQRDERALSMLYIRSSSGGLVRLDAVASVAEGLGPVTVNHSGQLPAVTISFSAAPGVSLSYLTQSVETLAARILPEGVTSKFEGSAGAYAESMQSLYFLLFLAIVIIYIILGCLYESFIHPLTILSGLPSAALGGLVTLWAFGMQLDLYGFVGIIMLIGIVKKNAIMVVDFAIEEEKKGETPEQAALNGSLTRFRPILMTTSAAIMGAFPIAIGYGAGGEARQPLGLAVVGGLILSQVVTLYLTPVYYTYLDELQHWISKRVRHPESE